MMYGQQKGISFYTWDDPYLATVMMLQGMKVSELYWMRKTETWIVKVEHVKCLRSFHNHSIRTILGVTKYQHWKEHISSNQLASAFGMEEPIANILMEHRLHWLGHMGRMEPEQMSKQLLFGELEKKWRDGISAGLQATGIKDGWYEFSQERTLWRRSTNR